MDTKKIDWKVVGKWFLGLAIARILCDFSTGEIDSYGVIGIPLIAVGWMYFFDKKWFLKKSKNANEE